MTTTFTNESKPVTIRGTDAYGDSFEGEFTFKIKLSAMDRLRQDQLYREYLVGPNPENAGDLARDLAFMLSQINSRIKSVPVAWSSKKNGLEAANEFIVAVFTESMKPESEFIAGRDKAATKAQEKLRADRDAERLAADEEDAAYTKDPIK